MAHRLQKRIRTIARKVRSVWLLHGLGLLISLVLGTALLLGFTDHLLRLEDLGLRVMVTVVLIGCGAYGFYRFILIPFLAPLSPVALAQRLEQQIPSLAQRLASSLEFLSEPENDVRSGSDELRRIVIHQTTQLADQTDWSKIVDERPAIRSLSVAMSLALLVGCLFVLRPDLALVSVRRLTNPFNQVLWPQHTHLALRNPVQHVASGQPFEVEVYDRGQAKLPPEVWMLYRTLQPDGSFREEKELLPIVSDSAIVRREQVTRPFSYRAIGGDDRSMPWTDVAVLDPPALATLEMTLHYPAYTSRSPETVQGQLRAVTGTKVEIQGSTTKRLRSASVVYEDGREIPLPLATDRTHFFLASDAELPFVIDKTSAYWFNFEDAHGLVGGSEVRYDMRAVPVLAPNVTIDSPPANSLVTPSAIIPLRLTVTDDLALKQIALNYLRSDESDRGDQARVLYEGPSASPLPPNETSLDGRDLGERRSLDTAWNLAEMALAPGVQITFYVTADDYQPLTGRSTPRMISVVAPEELERRLEERQALLLAELDRILKLQREARTQTGGLRIQAEKIGVFEQVDIDRLHAAVLQQRQVTRALSARDDGLRAKLREVLADIENNHLDNPEIRTRSEEIEVELARIEAEHLPKIEQALTSVEKSPATQTNAQRSDPQVVADLNLAEHEQMQVVSALEQLLGKLSQWDSQRRLVHELADVQQRQQILSQHTAELGRETLSSNLSGLSAQQRTNLKKLAGEQHELARRYDAVEQQMQRAAAELSNNDPLVAQAISDAIEQARAAVTAGKMQQAGAGIEQNKMGQALTNQRDAVDNLQEMLDILSNRHEHELARLVKKLREAEAELATLRNEQAGLKNKFNVQASQPSSSQKQQALKRLAGEQRETSDQTNRLRRRLERLKAEQAAAQMAAASGSMKNAVQQGDAGQAEGAEQQAATAEEQLGDAQQQLAERLLEAEQELAFEQFMKTRDQVAAIRDRQATAVQETQRLQSLLTVKGKLSSAELESVQAAAANQQDLADSTNAVVRKLENAVAFGFALTAAHDAMHSAVGELRQQKIGALTLQYQSRALSRLERVLAALAPDQEDMAGTPQEDSSGGGGSGAGNESGAPSEQIPNLAQLKLLKLLQQDLNDQTVELAARKPSGSFTDTTDHEYGIVAKEQQRLAEVIRLLAASTRADQRAQPTTPNHRKESE